MPVLCVFSVDCTWRNWGSWEACSKTCGSGTKSRSRSKDGPLYGGRQCSGSSTDLESCNLKNCPGEEKILIIEGENKNHYFQLMATGGVGVHGVHVPRHVVRAPRLVQGQKLGLFMVDLKPQAPQLTQNLAT